MTFGMQKADTVIFFSEMFQKKNILKKAVSERCFFFLTVDQFNFGFLDGRLVLKLQKVQCNPHF